MKKLITLTALVAAISVQAASINWQMTGSASAVANDYLGSAYASTVYLVVANDLASITSDSQTASDFETALAALTVATTSTSDGKKPSITNPQVTSSKLTEGQATTFGLLIVSEDADGNGYYKIITSTGTPYADGATAEAQTKVATAWNFGNKSWVQGYAVPEPATGALALAGVALLFRRRRA